MIYTLTASRNGKTQTRKITADSDEWATLDAIDIIMDLAYANKEGAWAKGEITLTAPNGEIIRQMEEKE